MKVVNDDDRKENDTASRIPSWTGRISLDIRDSKSIPRSICLNGDLYRSLFYSWRDEREPRTKWRNCTQSTDTDGLVSILFHFRRFRFPLVLIGLYARYIQSKSMQPSPRSLARSLARTVASRASWKHNFHEIVACDVARGAGRDDGFDCDLPFSLGSKKSLVLKAIRTK